MIRAAHFTPNAVMVSAAFIGRISLIAFLVFLFNGTFHFIQLGLSDGAVLVWDGLLSVLFFLQHSGMVRRGFRARLANVIPQHYHGAFFSIVSGIVLMILVATWQSSSTLLYDLRGFARWMTRCLFFLSVAGLAWGAYTMRSFDPFGRIAIRCHLKGRQLRPPQFVVRGPYLWVRHPLYSSVLLMIWLCPELSTDRLLFNILWTAWICIGTVLEEADLMAEFGDAYSSYRRRAPMLIPWRIPRDS